MINLLLIANDIENGAINKDILYSKEILQKKCNVYIIHDGNLVDNKRNIFSVKKFNLINKFFYIKNFCKSHKINVVHIKGLISLWHLYYFFLIHLLKINYVISLFSQLNSYNLNNKLFFENPDIKRKKIIKNNFKDFLLRFFGPFFKKIFLIIFGKFIISKAKYVICFSKYEEKIAKKYTNNTIIIKEPSFINKVNFKKKKIGIYNKKIINVIYWGRIDFLLKGIDRILNLALSLKKSQFRNKIKFYIAGPDYNKGLSSLINKIDKDNLQGHVKILKKKYWKNINTFKNADYNILLSRWDGFPRSLRESLYYNVPLIVSDETNFSDIIKKYKCGLIINKFDNDHKNNLFFNEIVKNKKNFKKSCYLASKEIHPKKIRNTLIELYKKVIN